jgi:predicted acyl esterase
MMHHLLGRASREHPDRWHTDAMYRWVHDSLDSGELRGSQAQWDKIAVPMFTVGNWSGMALHLRGNTEAFTRAASKHKKLRIHGGSHVHAFYTEDGRIRSVSLIMGLKASRTASWTSRRSSSPSARARTS